MSWVISVINCGRPLGAIAGTMIVNYWGSKTGTLISCVPMALCWLFTALASNVVWLYVARTSSGIGIGMIYSCYSLYLAEIADPSNRGMLLAMGASGLPSGMILMSILGAYLPMKQSAVVGLILCCLLIALFAWSPESPHYFVKNNQEQKARSSIGWYHRNCDVEFELAELQKFIEDLSVTSVRDMLREMRTKRFSRSLIIIGILYTYFQLSGIVTVLFYIESIFRSVRLSVIEPSKMVMIMMVFGLFGAILSVFLMDKCGRKILMIVSSIGIALGFTLLTLEFHLLSFGFDPKTLDSLSIAGMILFNMTLFLGVIPVPSTMTGEIFPPHLKCVAACMMSCLSGVVAFIVACTYLHLLHLLTERYVFLFYAVILLTAVPFTIFCVPETKGLSLLEIQENQLSGKNKSRNASTSTAKENVARKEIVNIYNIHDQVTSRDTK